MIVNCARGGLVDEAALRAGLDSGHIGGAAFDVFVTEPAKENVLFGAPGFVATPHLGASTGEAQENVALQVAEQMSDYLLTGAVTNALNSPSITADEAPKLKPYVALAERLGAFAGQMVDVGLKGVDVAFEGEVAALNVRPLAAAALAGVMRPMLAEINMVSAPAVARERGVTVSESRQDSSPIYENLMRITVVTEMGRRSFAGTVVAGAPRIVEVKGMELESAFAPAMLYVNNLDKPGFIGALGALLGEAGVNIATFNLGRVAAGDDAIALVGIDQAPDDALIGKIRALPHVKEARALRF
jgi:D-3-phosphoglycerate dehydrogenase